MPLFAAFFSSVVTAFATFLAEFIRDGIVRKGLAVTSIITFTGAFIIFFNQALTPFLAEAFSTQYGQFIGLAFPPISGSVMTAYVAAIFASQAYKMKVRLTSIAAGG